MQDQLNRIIKHRTKVTVVFNHTKTRSCMLQMCILTQSEDGLITAKNTEGRIRFWLEDINQIYNNQINITFDE